MFRRYGNPSSSSPRSIDLPALRGFGGTVIQVVVHPQSKYQQLWHQFRRHRKSSSSSPLQVMRPSTPVFRKYRNPSSSSPTMDDVRGHSMFRRYGNPSSSSPRADAAGLSMRFWRYRKPSSSSPKNSDQSLVTQSRRYHKSSSSSPLQISAGRSIRFGGTVNQVVVHRAFTRSCWVEGFGGTVD